MDYEMLAQQAASASVNAATNGKEILFFTIAEKTYGIEIKYINEIIGIDNITVVPKIPDYIKGVINIRGKVVPVISVRLRFGIEEIPYDDRTCIIVLDFDSGIQVGIVVDRVREVTTVTPEQISKTPDSKNLNSDEYINSIITIDGETRLFLDCEKLIDTE